MDWATTDWAGTPVVTAVGEKIPAVCLDYGFGPDQEKVNLAERCAVLACMLVSVLHIHRIGIVCCGFRQSQKSVGLTI